MGNKHRRPPQREHASRSPGQMSPTAQRVYRMLPPSPFETRPTHRLGTKPIDFTPAGRRMEAFACDTCAGHTVTVALDSGGLTTRMACRVGAVTVDQRPCPGTATSMGLYGIPGNEWPRDVPATPRWLWYRPAGMELARLRSDAPALYEHVSEGGLVLDRLRGA